MKKYQPVVASAIGGASPSLVYLAMICTSAPEKIPTATYFLGVLLYAVIGAVMAWIWEETNLRKAFYIGFGLPAFFNASIANFTSLKDPDAVPPVAPSKSANVSFINSAYAQEPVYRVHAFSNLNTLATNKIETPASRVLVLQKNPGMSDITLVFVSGDGRKLEHKTIDLNKNNSISVPGSAQSVIIHSEQFDAVQQPLSQSQSNLLVLQTQKRLWSGFERAIGIKGVKDFKLEIQNRATR